MADKKPDVELKAAEEKVKAEAAEKAEAEAKDAGPKTTVALRHKTQYPKYRRAGLVLSKTAAPFEVTPEQLAALKKDPWVEVASAPEPEGAK